MKLKSTLDRDPKTVELLRAAQANLVYIRSGQARRDAEEERRLAKLKKQREKDDQKRIKKLQARVITLRKELEDHDEFYSQCETDDNPLGYAEGMTAADKQGLLEEIDAAREGCLTELLAIEQELREKGHVT